MEAGGWGKELLVKEKKRIVSGQDIFFLGGRKHKFFIIPADYLIRVDQKISD